MAETLGDDLGVDASLEGMVAGVFIQTAWNLGRIGFGSRDLRDVRRWPPRCRRAGRYSRGGSVASLNSEGGSRWARLPRVTLRLVCAIYH